jgi:hypothetical protein
MLPDELGQQLRVGQRVHGCDGEVVGTITAVWDDVGVGEAWGAVGAIPIEGAAAAVPELFAFSEAMPGEGDSYFCLESIAGAQYVPFSYVSAVHRGVVKLSVAASDLPALQWDVRPDFLADSSLPDSGAPSNCA